MGNCKGKEKNEIDEEIKQDRKKLATVHKLLLLGAGESGKSTLAKQVKLIHLAGFTEEEKKSYRLIINQNIITSMQTLIEGAEKFGLSLDAKAKTQAGLVQSGSDYKLTVDLAEAVKLLWAHESIKKTWDRASELQIIESASYYFDKIDTISADTYIPDEQDILRSRVKTTGIMEIKFQIEGNDFILVDVGGQRSERRKWLHCFQDVTAIIFCVSMSEYDQFLNEDDTVRRTDESTTLFEEICNSRWFGKLPVILFLNKYDLFKDKMKRTDLKVAFPEFDGGLDYKKGRDFLKAKYTSLNRQSKQIYVHITTATNTNNIKNVFADVIDIILKQSLADTGLVKGDGGGGGDD
jgi:GTPase SAR1 family protein